MTQSDSLDPSRLPGTHRSRIFIGGSYSDKGPSLLSDIARAVTAEGFEPVVADEYQLLIPERDIHDVTMALLHSCRLAIFELSNASGALMEIERVADYGTKCLVLYEDRGGAFLPSRMLSSFLLERDEQIAVKSYPRPRAALEEAVRWLKAVRRMLYARD